MSNISPEESNATHKSTTKARKRAAKACLSCRRRKVRCDVSQRGRPCMNCYLDSETCVVIGRASRLARERVNHDQITFPEQTTEHQNGVEESLENSELDSRPNEPPNSPKSNHEGCSSTACETGHEIRENRIDKPPKKVTQKPPITQDHELSRNPNFRPEPKGAAESRNFPSAFPLGSTGPIGDKGNLTADVTYSYYPFICVNNLQEMLPQDINYLEMQGCLRIPTRAILDEFIQQYFLHIHPYTPLLHEGDFWEMYSCSATQGSSLPGDRVSLLVLQSMLFTSCNFVSKANIKALGFSDIRTARSAFYRRAKLLFDFDSERSPMSIAQAAVLLTFWSPPATPARRKPNSAWLSIAISSAMSAEAHHYSALPPFSPITQPLEYKKQNSLKRLWWSCIIRDRSLGLLMRRTLQITRAQFDFDANPTFGYADLADEIERSKVYNPETKRSLIEILVSIIELGLVMTEVLTLMYPLNDLPGWGRRMTPDEAGRMAEGKAALNRWYKTANLKFPMFGGGNTPRARLNANGKEFQHDSVILYTNLMYMLYHSSRVSLCHHEILQLAVASASPIPNSSLRGYPSMYENRHELQEAASGVVECLKELIQLRLARWLPASAVACTALPLVLHILDVKLSSHNRSAGKTSEPTEQEALKQHRLNILIEAMKTYRPQYDGVDQISETVRHIIDLAQLDHQPNDPVSVPQITSSGISDWTDILAIQPGCYLRLAMTMDLSLSKGRLPEDQDFPASLRGLFGNGRSSIKMLLSGGQVATSGNDLHHLNFLALQDPFLNMPPGTVQSISSTADSSSPDSMEGDHVSPTALFNQPGADGQVAANFQDHDFFQPVQDIQMQDFSTERQLAELVSTSSAGTTSICHESSGSSNDAERAFYNGEDATSEDPSHWIELPWDNDCDYGHLCGDDDGREQDSDMGRVLLDALRDNAFVGCGA